MKLLVSLLLSIAIVSSPLGAFAAPDTQVETASTTIGTMPLGQELVPVDEFRVTVDETIYALNKINEAAEDLDTKYANAALAGISRNVGIDLKQQYDAGQTLLATLVNDNRLDPDERMEKVALLGGALNQLTYRILRDRFADKKHVDELKETRSLVHFLTNLVIGTGSEFLKDGLSLWPSRSIEGEFLFSPVERGRREELARQIISLRQKFAAGYLPVSTDPPIADVLRTHMQKHTEKMIQIKQSRFYSQIAATGIYAATAYVAIRYPQIDIIGRLEGGRSENSLFVSSLGYLAFWSSMTVTKGLTITGASVAMLKDLQRLLANPNAKVAAPGVYSRLRTRLWGLEGEKKPVKTAPAKSFMELACKAFPGVHKK